MIESVKKGAPYMNEQGRIVEATGSGFVSQGEFITDEEMAQRLSRHGWKCQKRKGKSGQPDQGETQP